MVDTQDRDRYIGIILEYASGGELFDFILSQRCLKENVARRLFAQLVSGVGYLHKRGIVHRDLKLENLLLDSNRNIIITDFGFANTFDPDEALSEEEELNLTDKEWIKKAGLDVVKKNGSRKGDLMQTSCGSPCYAAPELVISDSLYTGRKVDVWSCGVILVSHGAGAGAEGAARGKRRHSEMSSRRRGGLVLGIGFCLEFYTSVLLYLVACLFDANLSGSTQCLLAISHSMTIQPIPRATTSTSCIGISCRRR